MATHKESSNKANQKRWELDHKRLQILGGSLLGLDFLFIQSLYSSPRLDAYSTYALIAFAVVIPILAMCLWLSFHGVEFGMVTVPKEHGCISMLLLLFAFFTNLSGIICMFFHFSQTIGYCFLGSLAGIAFITAVVYLGVDPFDPLLSTFRDPSKENIKAAQQRKH